MNTSSYLTDIVSRSHRADLRREAAAARAGRRARRGSSTQRNDFGETVHRGRMSATWNWFATAQL